MYSHRLPWFVSQNRFSAEVDRLRSAGIPLLNLSTSNPTTAGFDYPHQAIASALARVREFTYEPDPAGSHQAREFVSQFLSERAITVDASRILLTASTSEAYAHLFKLLCDPGDQVLIPLPSYPLFEYLAALENVQPVPYRLQYDGSWHLDFASLESAFTPRTKAIVVVNPNNPTGSFLKKEETVRLAKFAAERSMALISDEVFLDYTLQPAAGQITSLINQSDTLTFSLNGLSKSAGMPQMKLGWIVVSGAADLANSARTNLELILDTYLSVNTPVQGALPDLLAIGQSIREQIQQRTRQNFAGLTSQLAGSAANVLYTEAGWSAIIQLPKIRKEEDWLFALLDERVLVQPGYFFDMASEAYIVVSLITPPIEFSEGIHRLTQIIGRG